MREISDIQELQEIELGILRHIHSVCNQQGLSFYLSNGTLLGAVKYQGFIPWDDDIDLLMPRTDYEKLMHSELIANDRYQLCARERNARWRLPFAKLCDTRTRLYEGNADFGIPYGVGIDIFPLDAWSGGKAQALRCSVWRRGLSASVKARFATPKKGVSRGILWCIWVTARLFGSEFFLRKIDHELQKGRIAHTPDFVGSVAWPLYGKKEVIPVNVFSGNVFLKFEGEFYPVPRGYDVYLRRLYGKYEEDPPTEKQRTHHSFRAYWLESTSD